MEFSDAGGIDALFQIVGRGYAVAECDVSLCEAVAVGDELGETVVWIIDDKRGRAGKIAVRPGVAQHVHRYADSF